MGYFFLIIFQSTTMARYHGRFTRITFLLNESTKIMKFVLKVWYNLYFNLVIENRSAYKTNLFNVKKKLPQNYWTW